jgi:hypothetical protein
MHLEVVVSAIREQLRAARSEVGEPGDELFRVAVVVWRRWMVDTSRSLIGSNY